MKPYERDAIMKNRARLSLPRTTDAVEMDRRIQEQIDDLLIEQARMHAADAARRKASK
jgi:hypothetical protein